MRAKDMKSDSFRDFVLDQLLEIRPVQCRAMFGGYGLYQSQAFFGIIFKGRLYFKVSEESRAQYIEAGMGEFKPSKKMTLKSFHEVPDGVLESRPQISDWARTAIQAAKTKISQKRAKITS